jgi:hypothetical protein
MSIETLITFYGRSLTKRRPVWQRDSSGGAYISSTTGTTTSTISGYLQVGEPGVSLRYGRENVRTQATLYCLGAADIKPDDLLTVTIASEIRTYRVDTVRIPDDRPTSDPLCHKICALEEDYPRG